MLPEVESQSKFGRTGPVFVRSQPILGLSHPHNSPNPQHLVELGEICVEGGAVSKRAAALAVEELRAPVARLMLRLLDVALVFYRSCTRLARILGMHAELCERPSAFGEQRPTLVLSGPNLEPDQIRSTPLRVLPIAGRSWSELVDVSTSTRSVGAILFNFGPSSANIYPGSVNPGAMQADFGRTPATSPCFGYLSYLDRSWAASPCLDSGWNGTLRGLLSHLACCRPNPGRC